MGYLLSTTWFLIEAFLIPEGLLKWFYLSFYIHPLLLVLCQILLWVKPLISWTRRVLAVSYSFGSFVVALLATVFPGGVVDEPEDDVFVDAYGDMSSEDHLEASFGSNNLNRLHVMVVVSKVNIVEEELEVADTGMVIGIDEEVDEDDASVCSSRLTLLLVEAADGKNMEWDLFCEKDERLTMAGIDDAVPECDYRLCPMPSETDDGETTRIAQDPFYRKYEQAMGWFDLLNRERTCGISAILQAEFKETARRISSFWGEKAKKQLLRSLESDLELVYVAQTCFSWEILCYQQKKAADLLTNSSSSGASIRYDHIVVEELQKFQVLVWRFTEDERFLDGCRYREYVQARASCKSLLQVPDIPGGGMGEEEGVDLEEVIRAMEKCIRAFHGFVKADDKLKEQIRKSSSSSSCIWWRLSVFLKTWLSWGWSCHPPPVEDPRDLTTFSYLNSILLKKSLRLRDIRGRKMMNRRTSTRTSPSGDQPRREKETLSSLSLAEIDLELVARVLRMSSISTDHITWCQAKLDNISFSHGKLSRADIFPLFPS